MGAAMLLGMSRGAVHGSMFSVGRIMCTILRHVHLCVSQCRPVTGRLFKYAQLVSTGYASKQEEAKYTNVEDVVWRPAPGLLGAPAGGESRRNPPRGDGSETAATKGGPPCSQCSGLTNSGRYHNIDALHLQTARL